MMKSVASTAILAAALLSACSKPPPPPLVDAPIMIAGEEAYRAGDKAGLQKAVDAFAAKVPADTRAGAILGCGDEGYALRRAAYFKGQLEVLNNWTLFAAQEAGRFYFLYGVAFQPKLHGAGVEDTWPTDFECEKTPGHWETYTFNDRERHTVTASDQERAKAWEADLKGRLGEAEFSRQMNQAAKTLHAYHLSDNETWSPSH